MHIKDEKLLLHTLFCFTSLLQRNNNKELMTTVNGVFTKKKKKKGAEGLS